MRNILPFLILFFSTPSITQSGNTLSLDSCYAATLANNPLGRQFDLQERATRLQLEQLDAARLPTIMLNGKAQLQSENVRVPFEIPGQEPIELPLFVAQLGLDAEYTIYDGGATAARRQLQAAELRYSRQETVTALARLKQQVNDLFFAILLQRSRIEVLQASLRSLESRRSAVAAAIARDAALPSDEAQLRAEILRLSGQTDAARTSLATALAQLRQLTGLPIPDQVVLQLPEVDSLPAPERLQREELESFELLQQQILAQEALLTAGRRPRFSAFAQAGIGTPNPLNFFEEEPSPYALVGVRLAWKIFDWNQRSLQQQQLSVQSQEVAVRRDLFEFELQLRESALREKAGNLRRQLETDRELVALEESILGQKALQLEQGTATATDYIEQETRLIRARLQVDSHHLQLLRTLVDYETEKGLR